MARSITCPRCSTALRVGSYPGESVTCPRCLAEIPDSAPAGVTPTPASVPVLEAVCPECGATVGPGWRYCPSCQEPLFTRDPYGDRRSMEMDVRRDNTALTVCMILLAVLGGVGIVLMLLAGVTAAGQGEFTAIAIIVAGLFVVGLIGSLTVVFSKREMDTGHKVGLATFRSLAVAGIVFILFCLACVAMGVYLFVACLRGELH